MVVLAAMRKNVRLMLLLPAINQPNRPKQPMRRSGQPKHLAHHVRNVKARKRGANANSVNVKNVLQKKPPH